MNQSVIDVITSYKSRVHEVIKDQQTALAPTLDTKMIEGEVFEYLYDSKRTLVNFNDWVCYRCHYMPLKDMNHRKYIHYAISDLSIYELYYNNVIFPFLIFFNGKMLPWEYIRIVMSHENYYILCRFPNDEWKQIMRKPERVEIVRLCDGNVYTDFPVGQADNKFFGFNEDGTYSSNDGCRYSIMNEHTPIVQKIYHTTEGVNALKVDDNASHNYYPGSVTLFRNGILDTSTDIHFTGTLLTIGDGTNQEGDQLDFVVFRNTMAKSSLDNISKVSMDYIQPEVQKQNAGEEVPEYLPKLQNNFDFEMSRKKNYSTNVAETIEKIFKYNASLFEEAYRSNEKNLNVEEHTGQWMLDNMGEDGLVRVPRKHTDMETEYLLVLVNGLMYKFQYAIRTDADYIKIPVKDIEPEDSVVFMRFYGIIDFVFDLVVNKDDPYQKLDTRYINEKMVLFSTIPDSDFYEYPSDGLQHFHVEYEIDTNDEGAVKIILKNEMYYGKPLKVVYRRQFRSYAYGIKDVTDPKVPYRIDLGDKFMYCNDYSRYLVFYNGIRLGTEQYRLCLPVRSGTPYSKFELFLTTEVKEDDRIDVIYTPSIMKDAGLIVEIDEDGYINVTDKKYLDYPLHKNLYMVWANGKYIPNSYLANVDSTHLKVIKDIQSTKTVCLTRIYPDIEELNEAFHKDEAIWDEVFGKLTHEEIEGLLELAKVNITNTDEDIFKNNVPVRAIMLELIRQKYILEAGVDTSVPFPYDYLDVDQTVTDGTDGGGHTKLDVLNGSDQGNLDIKRDYV